MERACTFRCISVSPSHTCQRSTCILFKAMSQGLHGPSDLGILRTLGPVLSSFRPMFHLRCLHQVLSLPCDAGESESNALEKELQQKQSVRYSAKAEWSTVT